MLSIHIKNSPVKTAPNKKNLIIPRFEITEEIVLY